MGKPRPLKPVLLLVRPHQLDQRGKIIDHRAIAYANGGRFRARSKHEQDVWNECARLVGDAVVHCNALTLSEALADLELHRGLVSRRGPRGCLLSRFAAHRLLRGYQFDENFTSYRAGAAPPAASVGGGVQALRHGSLLEHVFGGLSRNPQVKPVLTVPNGVVLL